MALSRNNNKATGLLVLRVLATLTLVAAAGVLAWFAWQHYVYAPWTRDARVQANVVNIAPEVSGTVTRVAVADDRYVHKGDLLFTIQPVRYENAVAEAEAGLQQARVRQRFARRNERRLERLPRGGVSTQARQQAQSDRATANAGVSQAEARLAQARQDLEWATVRSPVTGYVTHLLLDKGDYARQGQALITIVNAQTFRVIAYFEETKLAHIHIDDPVRIDLMASEHELSGHVVSIGRGIAVANNASGERNLPSVDPVFQWVRLAQRVPVTIAFDERPAGLALTVGLSATVHVSPGQPEDRGADAEPRDGLVKPPADLEQSSSH